MFHVNGNQKKARVAMLTSDKIDFKIKTAIRDKEGYYILIKGSVQEEDITITYATNIRGPKYIKQILMDIKGEINSNIVGDFNKPLTSLTDHPDRNIGKHWP